jgi:hypothetical protein
VCCRERGCVVTSLHTLAAAGSGGAGPAGFGCDRWIREEKSAFALETEEEQTDGEKRVYSEQTQ